MIPSFIRSLVTRALHRTRPVNLLPRDRAALGSDVDYALQVARSHFAHLQRVGFELPGSSVLELGPGINFGPQLILASLGARVALADRFLAPWDSNYHPDFYRALRARWDGPAGALDAVIDANGYRESTIELVTEPAENLESLAAASRDLVLSNAVLEHAFALPDVCRELARVTKPGGYNFHQIDFRDHGDFSRPLEFLLMPDETFRRYFARKDGECGNRFRVGECSALFQDAGFEIVYTDENCIAEPDYLSDFIPRLRASGSRHRDWPEEDLRVLSALLVMRRTACDGAADARAHRAKSSTNGARAAG